MVGRWRRAALAALLVVGSTCAFLALFEGLAWLAGTTPVAHDPRYQAADRLRDCKVNPSHPENFCSPAAVKTKAPRLVVALGGSSVAGYPFGTMTPFPKRLDALLQAAHPGEYAVVNRGLMCKDSTYVRRCVDHVIEADPEVLIVYSGHNAYANWGFDRPRLRIFLTDHPWLYDVERLLMRSRFVSAWARAIREDNGGPTLAQPIPSPPAFQRAREVILARYTADISAVLDAAERAGTQVLLVTVASNLYEFPFPRSSWDSLPAWNDRWVDHFRQGIELHRSARFGEALASFKAARDLYPFGRAPSELNDRIRELAHGRPHVRLVDFERELERLGAEEGIGCNFFGEDSWCDQFHPNGRTHQLLAELLFEALEDLRGARDS